MGVSYEVTIVVRPDLVAAWEEYLPGHVDDVMATGCFLGCEIERNASGHYRCRYVASSQADLDRYLAEHAPGLRADVHRRFPDGHESSRSVWTAWR